MSLQRIHLWFGVVTLIVFLLTGQFMDKYLRHLEDMADGPRMLYRSAHIYLLWSGLLNLSLGLQPMGFGRGWSGGLKRCGSGLVLVAPPLMLISFFLEPGLSDFQRPYSRAATYLTVLGMMMHLIASRSSSRRSDNDASHGVSTTR